MVVNTNNLMLEGKPLDIPDQCVIDVTPLAIGSSILCGDIVLPANVKMLTNPKTVAVAIVKPGQKVEL